MINLNKRLEMTVTEYVPQFTRGASKHYNCDSFVTTGSFKKMYINKYARKDYEAVVNSFKARIIQ